MASFILLPCKIREGWFVPLKNSESVAVDWRGLCERVAPHKSPSALRALGRIQTSSFVGLRKLPNGSSSSFVVYNPNLSGDARSLVRANPELAEQLVSLYRVEKVEWDRAFQEPVGTPMPPEKENTTRVMEILRGPQAPIKRR